MIDELAINNCQHYSLHSALWKNYLLKWSRVTVVVPPYGYCTVQLYGISLSTYRYAVHRIFYHYSSTVDLLMKSLVMFTCVCKCNNKSAQPSGNLITLSPLENPFLRVHSIPYCIDVGLLILSLHSALWKIIRLPGCELHPIRVPSCVA